MLRIRIDGQDIETTPILLAKLVLDGKVDRHSPTRLPGATAEQSLEQSLGLPHCEALTAELHRRLQMMCSMDSGAVDVQELCTRVESLCQWRWVNAPVAARFYWVAGWLNELADRTKNAVEFYDAFLLMPSADGHLRLLALNNRGVLRVQLGRLDGVHDLARAAISDFGLRPRIEVPGDKISDCGSGVRDQASGVGWLTPDAQSLSSGANPQSATRNPQSNGLPAACFNLLNLINVSFGAVELLRAVDEELADYFSRLPDDVRTLWLGPPSGPEPGGSREGSSGPPPGGAARETAPGGACRDLLILRDPTYRRLNTLVAHLSAQARGLLPDSRRLPSQASAVFGQLSLWDCRLSGPHPGQDEAARRAGHPVQDPQQRYGEAASLLLSDDIPSVLARPENWLVRMEQSVREELAAIEGQLALGQYEPARSRLHVQRKLLLSLNARGPLAAVLARVEERLDAHQAQYHVSRALSALQSGPDSWDQVQGDLAEALRYDPSSWLTVSPLFGWGRDEGGREDPPSANWPATDRQPSFTTEQAGLLLGKVFRQLGADARKCLCLWRHVEMTLSPALAQPDAETLARARLLAEKCLDFWPAGSPQVPGRADPRHPVNRFLEAWDKARSLVEAERLLEARPPRLEEAQRHLAGILRSGVDTRDQLRRIVTGFYLAQCREEDAPSVQRQVLADLEAWAQALPQEAVRQMRGREIVEETEKVRVAVAGRSESSLCQARPDEPAAKDQGRGLLAESWSGRHPRPTQDETGNARKEA